MSTHWVVVGAGSAGCVAAARLAEHPDRSVTLIEAGPDLAPGEVSAAIDGPDFLAALAEPGRTHDLAARRTAGSERRPYLRGRGVGGSSVVNAMLAVRGPDAQYAGWGWDDVDAAWERVRVPVERPSGDELGAVDRALLAAAPDAEPAWLTRREGRRITSAEAYLWPALAGDRGLVVRAGVGVDRVVFEGRTAVGVRLADGAEVGADRVVLAAGAIHTPAILLRSGVGTPGVGEGLCDHPSAPVTLHLEAGARSPVDGLIVGTLLERGRHQVLPMNHLGASAAHLGVLMVGLMNPAGRSGRVRLDEDDPSGPPLIDLDLLAHPDDRAAMRAGVGLLLDLLDRPSFTSIVSATTIDDSGTPASRLRDPDVLDRWIGTAPNDYVHATSTCAMGRVVDRFGALLGYESLYVCDASVFPHVPRANPHLPTTMLAERLVARW